MTVLDEVCADIRNYFTDDKDKYIGDFKIEDGVLSPLLNLSQTTLIRISGSRYNDGVHYSNEPLIDEEFRGGVWIMSPPQAFLDLVKEIEAWQAKNGTPDSAAMSPFTSESFGGYQYMKSGGSFGNDGGSSGSTVSWQSAYRNRLKIYRKARL